MPPHTHQVAVGNMAVTPEPTAYPGRLISSYQHVSIHLPAYNEQPLRQYEPPQQYHGQTGPPQYAVQYESAPPQIVRGPTPSVDYRGAAPQQDAHPMHLVRYQTLDTFRTADGHDAGPVPNGGWMQNPQGMQVMGLLQPPPPAHMIGRDDINGHISVTRHDANLSPSFVC